MANGSFGGGDGTSIFPYLVEDAKDLDAVRNNLTAHYLQTKNIDLSSYANWEPIGVDTGFSGSFNGASYDISNLKISSSATTGGVGLFGEITNSTCYIHRVRVRNCSIACSGSAPTGALVGRVINGTSFEHCSSTGTIASSGTNTGGLFGFIDKPAIRNCWSSCSVTSSGSYSGGFAGNIEGCKVENCYASGNVSGDSNVGGFCGSFVPNYYSSASFVLNCYASGVVSGSSNCSGFTNRVTHNGGRAVSVKNCFALNPSIRRKSGSSSTSFYDFCGSMSAQTVAENNYALDSMQFIQLQ